MDDLDSEWQRKGATLSDKTARREFGLTQNEIVRAIRAGTLHYRRTPSSGTPSCGCFDGRSKRWSSGSTGPTT